MLDVRRLRVLQAVAEHGSFSAAADALSFTQSAVSQQIAALEREAGTTLVQRGGGPLRLTDAGRALVTHADAVLARLADAERELAAIAGLEGGRVRLASFPTAGATLVTRAISLFSRRHPEVQLMSTEAEPEESLPRLKKGDFDLILVFDYETVPLESDRDLEFVRLLEEPVYVALPKGHPLAAPPTVSLEELASEQWVCGTDVDACRESVRRACLAAGFEPQISFSSSDYQVLQGLVAAGMGVTLLPELALAARNPGVEIRAPSPPVAPRRVWAAAPAERYRSPATEAMIGVLREVSARFERRSATGSKVAVSR